MVIRIPCTLNIHIYMHAYFCEHTDTSDNTLHIIQGQDTLPPADYDSRTYLEFSSLASQTPYIIIQYSVHVHLHLCTDNTEN